MSKGYGITCLITAFLSGLALTLGFIGLSFMLALCAVCLAIDGAATAIVQATADERPPTSFGASPASGRIAR